MVRVFAQIMVLLADSAAEASRLMTEIEGTSKRSQQVDHGSTKEEPRSPTGSPHLQAESDNAEEMGKGPTSPGSSADWADVQDNVEGTNLRAPSVVENRATVSGRSVSGTASPRDEQNNFSEFPSHLNKHVDLILSYLDQAQQECCVMFRSEVVEVTYNEIDGGRIIALIMDSVLRGHSTSESMPALDIEEIYATYTTFLVGSRARTFTYADFCDV
jgi:hypothetical protein